MHICSMGILGKKLSDLHPPKKTNMTDWKIHHEWRFTVFPIQKWLFFQRHVTFQWSTPLKINIGSPVEKKNHLKQTSTTLDSRRSF